MPKYDPRLKTPEELSATFVCGREIAKDIMAALEPRKGEELSHQSWIVTGPRGAGKTHLLTHLYHKIKEDEKFSKAWLPVSLPEEMMGGGNLLLFLKILTNFLGKELKKESKDHAALIGKIENLQEKKVHGSKKEQEKQRRKLEREYFGLWREVRQGTGRKIIFLLENIQDVMVYKLKKTDLQELRSFMHEYPEAMIIIGAALNVFGGISLPDEPFYHFFRLRSLEALGPESMMEFLEREMQKRGRPDLVEKIRESAGEVHAYRLLTGGNARLALVLADILEETEGLEIGDIIRKVTELTPYFKHETDSLTNIKQSILEALCSDLPAMTVKEIAAHVDESPQAVQENLKHLLREGKVKVMDMEPGGGVKGSETFYAVSDYFYRIWLQVRQGMVGQDHTEWIAELFAFVYEEGRTVSEQMRAVYDRAREKMSRPEYAERIATLKAFYAMKEKEEKWGVEVKEAIEVIFREGVFLGELKKALEIIKKELRERREEIDLLNAYGVGIARSGDLKEAVKIFREIVKIHPDFYEAWTNMGNALHDAGKPKEAIDAYKTAVKIKPDVHQAWYNMGISLHDAGKLEEAIEAYKTTLKIKPNMHEAWHNIGSDLYKTGKLEEAIEAYKTALKIKPNDYEACYNMGNALHKAGKLEEAIDAYKSALKIKHDKHEAWYNMGKALCDARKLEEAIEAFTSYILILAPLFRSVDILATEVFRKSAQQNTSVDKEITVFSDTRQDLEARFHAAIRLLYLDRFDGIEALFAPLFNNLEKNAEIQKLALFHFQFETIRRITDGQGRTAVAGRYWLRSAQNLQALGVGEMRQMVMLFVFHLLTLGGEKVSLEAVEELFSQWEKEGLEVPDMAPLLIRAVKDPASREAKVWKTDPLFAELLKLIGKQKQPSAG